MEISRELVFNYLKVEGAVHMGVATPETLAGGPPSTDLSYVMPSAKAAIVFALPLKLDAIPVYLEKKDRISFETDYIRKSSLGDGIAVKLANFLAAKGFPSTPLAVNEIYRYDNPDDRKAMYPDISLRYLAAASGVGSLGFSGNLLTNDYGPAIILGGLLTEAELTPTSPLDEAENYCDYDKCLQCCGGCVSGTLHGQELVTVSMGGHRHSYGIKKGVLPCAYTCGGFTGLHPSGKFSTWSPGRFPTPQTDEEVLRVAKAQLEAFNKRPEAPGGRYHTFTDRKIYYVCSNCQFICTPDKEERKRRNKLVRDSGVVVQNEDGTLEALTPEEAHKRMDAMDPERRAMYEGEIEPDPNGHNELIQKQKFHHKL
jgi:epoxyqueuosine reductase QueG